MTYDWQAIEREWSTGRYASVRALATSLRNDSRFEGNAPSHVSIQKRMNEAATSGKPWVKNLAPAVDAAVEAKIAMIGATSTDERQAIEEAANTRVAVVVAQRSLGVQLQSAFNRWFNLVNSRLDWEEKRYKTSKLPPTMEQCDEIMAMTGRMMLAAERLSSYVTTAFGLEKGWVPNPRGEDAGPGEAQGEEDVDQRAGHTKERVAKLIALWSSAGPSPLGAGSHGVDREPQPD